MKNLLKSVLSLAVAAALCFTCVTASASTFVVTGNETDPLTVSDDSAQVSFQMTAAEFDEVVGQDFQVRLPDVVESVVSVTAKADPGEWELTENQNYTVNGTVLHFVDVFNVDSPNVSSYVITVTVKLREGVPLGDYPVQVTDGTFVDQNEQAVNLTSSDGRIVVGKAEETVNNSESAAKDMAFVTEEEKAFVPYGGVWYGDGAPQFIDKNPDGSFTVPAGQAVHVTKFKLPAEGKDVTTFGASVNAEETLQFGSYVPQTGKEYGTLVVEGDFAALCQASPKMTTDEVLQRLVMLYDQQGKAIKVNFGGKSVNVYKVAQQKYMWKNSENNRLEYALRLTNLAGKEAVSFTAAGYSLQDGAYLFSQEVKTAVYSDIAPLLN